MPNRQETPRKHTKDDVVNCLITGNKGYIASGLSGDGIDIKDGVDICNYKRKKCYDVVIHTAAKTSVTESMNNLEEYERVNVLGTLNMLRQHPKAHFIYLSTASIYGEGTDHTIYSPVKPESIYSSTKLSGEFLVKHLANTWVILRLTNVIGDGDRGEPNVYQIFKKEKVLPIFGDGLQTRDFIHVDRVREIIMKSINKYGTFNVGSGKSRTVLEVAREFKKPIKFLPARKGEIRNFGIKDAVDITSF